MDVRSLAGLASDDAIARIVDSFCPPGILDEEIARIAIGEALASTLGSADPFDPAALDASAVRTATLAFVAELVFVSVAGDGGKALQAAPSPMAAAQREADLHSLIREVTDHVGAPLLEAAGAVITPPAMNGIVAQVLHAVHAEMEGW